MSENARLTTPGSVAEWSIAPVLKTGGSQGSVSSNLTASAKKALFMGLSGTPASLPPIGPALKFELLVGKCAHLKCALVSPNAES